MGAATVMMTAGEDIPEAVRAVIADCGYTSEWDIFAYHLKLMFHLPTFPLLNLADIIEKLRRQASFREASAVSAVEKSRVPILFIHGEADVYVPYAMVHELVDAANCKKELLTIPDTPHACSAYADPSRYWSTVFSFIEQNM